MFCLSFMEVRLFHRAARALVFSYHTSLARAIVIPSASCSESLFEKLCGAPVFNSIRRAQRPNCRKQPFLTI